MLYEGRNFYYADPRLYFSILYIKNCYKNTSLSKSKSSKKLASGYQINTAADDAAKLSISEKMRAQIRGLDQASNNIQDSISLLQVADGALETASAITQRIRELSVQAANDTYTDQDRAQMQQECDQLQEELHAIFDHTTFHTRQIFSKIINPDELSPKDISDLLDRKELPIFKTAQTIDGNPIPADTLNIISRSLRYIHIAKEINEKIEKGKIKRETTPEIRQERLLVEKYVLEFTQYLREYAGYGENDDYLQRLDNVESLLRTIMQLDEQGLSYDERGRSRGRLLIYANSAFMYIYPSGVNFLQQYATHMMKLLYIVNDYDPNGYTLEILKNDILKMNTFYTKLEEVPKTYLKDTSLIEELKSTNPDYDSVYKMLLNVFNESQKPFSFQIGANAGNTLQLQIKIPLALLTSPPFALTSAEGVTQSVGQADELLTQITMQRSEIGAYQNRLESAFLYTEQTGESLQDTESRMRDANIAKEAADYVKTKLQNEFQLSLFAQKNAARTDLSALSFPEQKNRLL